MAVSLSEILAALQNGVTAIRDLKSTLETVFPQATATSTVAPSAGALTFSSSQPSLFLTVQTSSGGEYKVPLY